MHIAIRTELHMALTQRDATAPLEARPNIIRVVGDGVSGDVNCDNPNFQVID